MSEVDCFAADVSKRELVIAIYPGGVGVKRIANQEAVINAWLDTLPAGSVIAMEATGIYHRRLADLAHTRGLVVYVVNPRDVYYDVRGMGARGKTDPSDAKLLARYVAHERMHLHPYLPPSALCERLVTLLEHRAGLVRTRQALTQSLAELPALGREKPQSVQGRGCTAERDRSRARGARLRRSADGNLGHSPQNHQRGGAAGGQPAVRFVQALRLSPRRRLDRLSGIGSAPR